MGGIQSVWQMWRFAETRCRLVWRGSTPARRNCKKNDMVRSLVGSWYISISEIILVQVDAEE